jgi:hypothetical protein
MLPNPFGEIPVVEFSTHKGSEIKDVIPQQDAVNYLLIAAFGGAEFTALPQRGFFTGADEPAGGWRNDPGRIWRIPPYFDHEGKAVPSSAFEFKPYDQSSYVKLVETMLQHMALTSKTPMRYFFQSDRGGRGDAPSGESLKVEDGPLLDKVEVRQTTYGNSWYKVARLVAKAASKNYRFKVPLGEPVWKDPQAEYRSVLLEQALMMFELGISLEFIVKHLGFSREETEILVE